MTTPAIAIWYRNDLRLHDCAPLSRALQHNCPILPIYCFDDRQFQATRFGFPKTGAFRTQFLLESVADLRRSLRSRGSDLILRRGLPERIIPAIARDLGITAVYFHREVTSEEVAVENVLQSELNALNVACEGFWGTTLYHPGDLPFAIADLPDLFTHFRKAVEKQSSWRSLLRPPAQLPPLPAIDAGELPDLTDLGIEPLVRDPRGVMDFTGGETTGLDRLQAYFWDRDCLKTYKETRNRMLGADYSSKFSPWLALGCLSPRYIAAQVRCYERDRIANDSTYWLVFELLWRDYFRFVAMKYGDRLFSRGGLQGKKIPWRVDWEQFQNWKAGMTGYPLVDANMRELAVTGFMSNRGRQNVASFLTKNLGIDWRMGAEWFESQLVDYDACSNYGNWNYTAGIGNDARNFRYFNIPKQSRDYDPEGHYLKHWLPELASIPAFKIHEPWKIDRKKQREYGIEIGKDYPKPVIDFWESIECGKKIQA